MATSAEATYAESFSGKILGSVIRILGDDSIIPGQPPSNITIDNGIAVTMKTGVDGRGFETNIGVNQTEYKPVATLTYGISNPELVAFQQGRKMRGVTATLPMPHVQQVLATAYPPVLPGKKGFNVASDTPTKGWAQNPASGAPVILSQQPFATFDESQPNSFAIGTNFARKFSTNLLRGNANDPLTARQFVTLRPMVTLPVRSMSEEEIGYVEISAMVKLDTGKVLYLWIPTAFIDPSGSGFNPGENTLTIKAVCAPLGRCEGYYWYRSNEEIFCEAIA